MKRLSVFLSLEKERLKKERGPKGAQGCESRKSQAFSAFTIPYPLWHPPDPFARLRRADAALTSRYRGCPRKMKKDHPRIELTTIRQKKTIPNEIRSGMVLLFGELNVADVSKHDLYGIDSVTTGVKRGVSKGGKGDARQKSGRIFSRPLFFPRWSSFFLRLSFSGERKPERRFDEAKSVALPIKFRNFNSN